jgi:hypothetical protein
VLGVGKRRFLFLDIRPSQHQLPVVLLVHTVLSSLLVPSSFLMMPQSIKFECWQVLLLLSLNFLIDIVFPGIAFVILYAEPQSSLRFAGAGATIFLLPRRPILYLPAPIQFVPRVPMLPRRS